MKSGCHVVRARTSQSAVEVELKKHASKSSIVSCAFKNRNKLVF
jgi:hypothetical protein